MAVPPPRVVSTRRLLSRPTCLFFFVSVFIPKAVRARETFISYFALNRNGGTTDDSGRRSDAISGTILICSVDLLQVDITSFLASRDQAF